MNSNGNPEPQGQGFELDGTFYLWSVTDQGKDLMLIDRITGVPINEFFELLDDETGRSRGPILLGLIATSIRATHPEWTVERIVRTVMEMKLSEVTFVGGEEDTEPSPPPETQAVPSSSPPEGSSSSPTPTENSPSKTSYAAPV